MTMHDFKAFPIATVSSHIQCKLKTPIFDWGAPKDFRCHVRRPQPWATCLERVPHMEPLWGKEKTMKKQVFVSLDHRRTHQVNEYVHIVDRHMI